MGFAGFRSSCPKIGVWSVVFILVCQGAAHALEQYASSVIGFSTQYSSGDWSAEQALGEPNTFAYGDIPSAWAPEPSSGSLEYLSLGFTTPVYATDVVVRETLSNGFVYQVDLIDQDDVLHTVFAGEDPSLPGEPVEFLVSFVQTAYLVKGVKIYVDTDHDLDNWEEIDSVKLIGIACVPSQEICNGIDDDCDAFIDESGYLFEGFFEPVGNEPIFNGAKAGQAIPLKFSVSDCAGTPVSDLSAPPLSVTVSSLACDAGTSADEVEEYWAGNSGLSYLGDGLYQFNWKTPKTYANSCKTLKLDLGDGVKHKALFKFKK